jgi:hypothetical protein
MTVLQGRTRRWLLLLTALAAAACSDSVSPRQVKVPLRPAQTISDGAHHGGNDDVFFLPPMVSNPNGAPGYGDPFAPNLPVIIRVVCTVAPDGSCDGSQVIAKLPATMDATNQMYMANWDTKASSLNDSFTYQIQVWVNNRQIAYADVDPVPNASQLKNISTQDTIGLVDGRTLPIKVRIEQGWACADRQSKLCTTQVVGNTTVGSPVTVIAPNNLAAGQFEGNWIPYCTSPGVPTGCVPQGTPVVVTVEDQTALLSQPLPNGGLAPTCSLINNGVPKTQMLSDSHCVKFTTDPTFKFAAPVKVAVCVHADELSQQLLKYDTEENPRFLENVPFQINGVDFTALCESSDTKIGSRSSNKMVNFALAALSVVGRGIRSLVVPKSAYAIHTGVGGLVDAGDGFSYVSPGRPLTMSLNGGDGQSATVNTAIPIAPRVQITSAHGSFDLESGFPDPLQNLQVQCVIDAGSGSFSPTPVIAGAVIVDAQHATTLTDANGVATCPSWILGAIGPNHMTASYSRIDNGTIAVEDAPTRQEVVLHNSVTFSETGTTAVTTGGNDLVVFGDANIFDNSGGADSNNQQLFRNLVSYSSTAARGSSKNVYVYCGSSLHAFCAPGSTFQQVLSNIGYSVQTNPNPGLPNPLPDSVKVVILVTPTTAFTSTELGTLQLFASQGGRIVLLGEYPSDYGAAGLAAFNSVLAGYGYPPLAPSSDIACGSANPQVVLTDIAANAITTGVKQVTVECGMQVGLGEAGANLFFYDNGDAALPMAAVAPVPPIIE